MIKVHVKHKVTQREYGMTSTRQEVDSYITRMKQKFGEENLEFTESECLKQEKRQMKANRKAQLKRIATVGEQGKPKRKLTMDELHEYLFELD